MNKSSSRNYSIRIHSVFATFAAWLAFLAAISVVGTAVSAATVDSADGAPATDAAAGEEPVAPLLKLPFADDEVRATSLFHVARNVPRLLGESRSQETDGQWEIFRRTQLAYLRSYFVIQSALRAPGIAQLSLLKSQPDPVGWLIDHLESDFEGNSEILRISLRGPRNHADELRQIVDAVSEAYLSEVVYNDQQRALVVRDALQRSYSALNDEIRNKFEVQMALARELGVVEPDGRASVKQQIDLRRLERIDAELLRLEGEQLAATLRADERENKPEQVDRAQLQFFDRRIEQLRKTQAELEERISQRDDSSVELTVGGEELASLQAIAHEMNMQLEKMDIESVAPDRIRRIQKATITPASSDQ